MITVEFDTPQKAYNLVNDCVTNPTDYALSYGQPSRVAVRVEDGLPIAMLLYHYSPPSLVGPREVRVGECKPRSQIKSRLLDLLNELETAAA